MRGSRRIDSCLKGGCLCRALRYSFTAAPDDTGITAIAGCASILPAPRSWPGPLSPAEAFHYTQGAPGGIYRSSAWGQREFCRDCGTQLLFRNTEHGKTVDLNYVTLDDPEQLVPEYHIYTESRLKWLNIDDNLPRYRQEYTGITNSRSVNDFLFPCCMEIPVMLFATSSGIFTDAFNIFIQPGINSSLSHQLGVRPRFHQPALFQDEDVIGVFDGGQPVGR